MTKRNILVIFIVFILTTVISIARSSEYTKVEMIFDKDITLSGYSNTYTYTPTGETAYNSNTANLYTVAYNTDIISLNSDTIVFFMEISNIDSANATAGLGAIFDVTFIPTTPMGWTYYDTTTHSGGLPIWVGNTLSAANTKMLRGVGSDNIKPTSPGILYGRLSIWVTSAYATKNRFHLTIYAIKKNTLVP